MTLTPSKTDRWDLILFLFSLGGLVLCLSISLVLLVSGLIGQLAETNSEAELTLWLAGLIGILGLFGLPGIAISGKSWITKSEPVKLRAPRWLWLAGSLLFLIGLGIGGLVQSNLVLRLIVGVPAHFLAAGGPILVSISLVLQQLPAFSLRRIWGQFLGGLWLVPPIVLALELLALIPFILAAAIVLASFPEGMRLLDQLGELSEMPPDRWMPVLEGFLSQPLLLVLIGLFIALVVPILEEIWKSISIWPILGRRIHRLDGFLGGVLGGAGYALTETLLLGSPGEEWVLAMLSRSGTSMVHALTAGLTGWGLVEGFRHRKWGLLVRNFVLAVGLHGLWNGAALVAGLSIVNQEFQTPLPEGITVALSLGATLVVVLVAIGCFLGLIGVSRRLALDVRQAEGGAGSSEEALEPRRM